MTVRSILYSYLTGLYSSTPPMLQTRDLALIRILQVSTVEQWRLTSNSVAKLYRGAWCRQGPACKPFCGELPCRELDQCHKKYAQDVVSNVSRGGFFVPPKPCRALPYERGFRRTTRSLFPTIKVAIYRLFSWSKWARHALAHQVVTL